MLLQAQKSLIPCGTQKHCNGGLAIKSPARKARGIYNCCQSVPTSALGWKLWFSCGSAQILPQILTLLLPPSTQPQPPPFGSQQSPAPGYRPPSPVTLHRFKKQVPKEAKVESYRKCAHIHHEIPTQRTNSVIPPMMFQTLSDMLHSSTLTAAHFWPSLQLPLITAASITQLKLVSPK